MIFAKFVHAFRNGAIALATACLIAPSSFAQTEDYGLPPLGTLDASVTRDKATDLPHFNIYRPVNLSQQHKPMPVIVWANGGCMPWDGLWIRLFNRWAGAGYVVISYTNMDELKDYASQMRPGPAAGAKPAAPAAAPASMGSLIAATEDRQEQAIDWAIRANSAKDSPFYGKLDTKRIVAAGNSCGGITSLGIATHDKRIKSIFVLSGGSLPPGAPLEMREAIMSKITAPTIILVGGKDDLAHIPAGVDFSILPATTPGVMVYRSSGTHDLMSSDPGVEQVAGEIGLEWFRATLYHDKSAAKELTTKICPDCDAATWSVDSRHFFGSH